MAEPARKESRVATVVFVSLLVAVAIGLRFQAIMTREGLVGWDEYMYMVLGKHLLTGQGYQLFGLPNITFTGLVPIIAGATWMLTGSAAWALSAPSAIFGGLTVIPVYLLAKRMFSRPAALCAAILFVGARPLLVYNPFVPYVQRLYDGSEQIFLFFVMMSLLFFWRTFETRRVVDGALAGLFCGLAFQARQEALPLWMALGAWLFIAALLIERRLTRNLIARLAAVIVFFLVATAPYFLYAKSVTGHAVLGPHISHNVVVREAFKAVYFNNNWTPYFRLHQELNKDATEFESPYYGFAPFHRTLDNRQSGARTFENLLGGMDFHNILYWMRDMRYVLPSYILALVVFGFVARPSRQLLVKALFLAAVVAPTVAIAMMLLVLPRYDLYTVGIAIVFAGAGIVTFVRPHARTLMLPYAVLCYLMAGGLAYTGVHYARSFNDSYAGDSRYTERWALTHAPTLAEMMRPYVKPGALLMCHDPRVALAAGATWVPLPTADFPEIVAFCRHKGIEWILIRKSDTVGIVSENHISDLARKSCMRPFGFDEALARKDLAETVLSDKVGGEPVVLLRVPAEAKPQ